MWLKIDGKFDAHHLCAKYCRNILEDHLFQWRRRNVGVTENVNIASNHSIIRKTNSLKRWRSSTEFMLKLRTKSEIMLHFFPPFKLLFRSFGKLVFVKVSRSLSLFFQAEFLAQTLSTLHTMERWKKNVFFSFRVVIGYDVCRETSRTTCCLFNNNTTIQLFN